VEVYTPIPEASMPGVPRGVRHAGRVMVVCALVLVAAAVVRATFFGSSQASFHNFGVVHTAIGTAAVACGGEASDGCGVDTVIRFASCSTQFHDYFGAVADAARNDQLVRALIGQRPPSGDRWTVGCGGADGMIAAQPLAHLASN
jgi:hypothetical protein